VGLPKNDHVKPPREPEDSLGGFSICLSMNLKLAVYLSLVGGIVQSVYESYSPEEAMTIRVNRH
jgi:hypothetical protein